MPNEVVRSVYSNFQQKNCIDLKITLYRTSSMQCNAKHSRVVYFE